MCRTAAAEKTAIHPVQLQPNGRPCATADDPPTNTSSEPGEWTHGWQCWASSISDTFFRKSSLLSNRAAASRAHQRSHSGCNAGAALAHAPTTKEHTIPPELFRVLLLERLQLPCALDARPPQSSMHTEQTCAAACHSDRKSVGPGVSRSRHASVSTHTSAT